MNIRMLDEFLFMLKEAGFKTMGEVWAYMKKEKLNAYQLYNRLDKMLFPNFNEKGVR